MPTLPKLRGTPAASLKVDFSELVMSTLVMRASASGAVKTVPATTASARLRRDRSRVVPIVFIESPPAIRMSWFFGCLAILRVREERQRCRGSLDA